MGKPADHGFDGILDQLQSALRSSWVGETSIDRTGWTSDNPSHGQCAVSALVVQNYLGGELLRGLQRGVSHYWNRLPSGRQVDVTLEQFPEAPCFSAAGVVERSYVLSFAETVGRYQDLKRRVECSLASAMPKPPVSLEP